MNALAARGRAPLGRRAPGGGGSAGSGLSTGLAGVTGSIGARGATGSTTLERLRALRLVALVLFTVWAGIGLGASLQTRSAMETAQKRFIPEVAAAQQIKAAVAAMEAAATEQLARPVAAKGAQADAAEASRAEVVRALMDAAETGGADREALTSLEAALGTYGRLMQRVRDLHDRDEPPQWAVYREAAAVVDQQLEPRAEAMARAGDLQVQALVQQGNRRSMRTQILFVLVGLLTFAALAMAQLFLSRRTRRTLNPGLLGASFVCLAATGYLLQTEARAQETFHRALVEAYPAARAGWQARTAASLARDMESRASLDAARAAGYRLSAARQRDAVATLPLTLTGEQLVAALREGRSVDGFGGSLGEEWGAAGTAGEREAVTRALAAWLAPTAKQEPVHGPSVPFEQELTAAVRAHQRALDQAADTEQREQTQAELLLAASTLAAMAMLLAGFAPRIREYR